MLGMQGSHMAHDIDDIVRAYGRYGVHKLRPKFSDKISDTMKPTTMGARLQDPPGGGLKRAFSVQARPPRDP